MSKIVATFEVHAGTTIDTEIDTTGMTPDQIAEQIQNEGAYVGVCHQCADVIVNPEAEDLTGFSVDGVDYERVAGTDHWVVAE